MCTVHIYLYAKGPVPPEGLVFTRGVVVPSTLQGFGIGSFHSNLTIFTAEEFCHRPIGK